MFLPRTHTPNAASLALAARPCARAWRKGQLVSTAAPVRPIQGSVDGSSRVEDPM